MFGKNFWAVIILTLFGAAYSFPVAAVSGSQQFTFPTQIADLQLGHSSQGEEAVAEINRLHGKEIEMKNGYLAHYESDRTKAVLYISEFDSEDQAREQIDKMKKKIGKGSKGFAPLQELEVEERILYSLLGFHQIHYFYLDSHKVIWLAADPFRAELVLKDVLGVIK